MTSWPDHVEDDAVRGVLRGKPTSLACVASNGRTVRTPALQRALVRAQTAVTIKHKAIHESWTCTGQPNLSLFCPNSPESQEVPAWAVDEVVRAKELVQEAIHLEHVTENFQSELVTVSRDGCNIEEPSLAHVLQILERCDAVVFAVSEQIPRVKSARKVFDTPEMLPAALVPESPTAATEQDGLQSLLPPPMSTWSPSGVSHALEPESLFARAPTAEAVGTKDPALNAATAVTGFLEHFVKPLGWTTQALEQGARNLSESVIPMKRWMTFRPGRYVMTHQAGALVTESVARDSPTVGEFLQADTEVNVLELHVDNASQRLRARLESPSGWISLARLDSNYTWARPCPPAEVASPGLGVDVVSSAMKEEDQPHQGVLLEHPRHDGADR